MINQIKYFSMFSGIGGFEKGIEDAIKETPSQNQPSNHWNPEEFQCSAKRNTCVGYSEIDQYAAAIYRYHYPEHKNFGDARRIVPEELPNFDLLAAGFPCQSFSIAGKRGGFADTRGTLFFEIARIAGVKRPGYLLLENVKGLLSHDSGNTFATIIGTLDELGYDCQWQVLNSKNYGVPQNRERVFIIGHLRGVTRLQIFPIGETDRIYPETNKERIITAPVTTENAHSFGKNVTWKQARDIANAIDANYQKGWLDHGQRTMVFLGGIMGEANQKWIDDGKENSRNFPQGQRVYSPEGVSAQINSQGGGWGAKTGLYLVPKIAQALQTDGQLRSGTSWETDKSQSTRNIRRLTPIECERLQGFPDNWTQYGAFEDGTSKPISDSQRYKCCGNAVTTNVIKAIMIKFLEACK